MDERDIRQLLSVYVHGCDRCDAGLMGSVYWDDSWDDHGVTQGKGPEFARTMTRRVVAETEVLSHLLGQSLIRIEGDEASAETYFLAVQRRSDDAGEPLCEQLGGRYVDRLERRDGSWRIKHRAAVRDWSISIEVKQDHFVLAELTPGLRSEGDPGVQALGIAFSG